MKSPKIRFKEFQNEWNLTTLGEVGEIVGGGTPDTSNLKFWGDDIVWVTPTEIKNKYILYIFKLFFMPIYVFMFY